MLVPKHGRVQVQSSQCHRPMTRKAGQAVTSVQTSLLSRPVMLGAAEMPLQALSRASSETCPSQRHSGLVLAKAAQSPVSVLGLLHHITPTCRLWTAQSPPLVPGGRKSEIKVSQGHAPSRHSRDASPASSSSWGSRPGVACGHLTLSPPPSSWPLLCVCVPSVSLRTPAIHCALCSLPPRLGSAGEAGVETRGSRRDPPQQGTWWSEPRAMESSQELGHSSDEASRGPAKALTNTVTRKF